MVTTTFIKVCGKFQSNMSKVTTVMTVRENYSYDRERNDVSKGLAMIKYACV